MTCCNYYSPDGPCLPCRMYGPADPQAALRERRQEDVDYGPYVPDRPPYR